MLTGCFTLEVHDNYVKLVGRWNQVSGYYTLMISMSLLSKVFLESISRDISGAGISLSMIDTT